MKRFTQYTIGTVFALALSSAAWAQQRDLEVTMDVVPANASADATGEIKLPITLPATTASPQGQESSAFGLGVANMARELGRDFGNGVSEAAKDRDHTPNLPPQAGGRP